MWQCCMNSYGSLFLRDSEESRVGQRFAERIAGEDRDHLATTSQDGTVQLWDPVHGQGLQTLRGHTGIVKGVSFSPDGKRLASASTDGTVQIYALDVFELLELAHSRVTRNLTP
jgi:WD40 repeat protein